jgi:hypothetical protein
MLEGGNVQAELEGYEAEPIVEKGVQEEIRSSLA